MAEPFLSPIDASAQDFGRYELIGRLATGGMAEIYLARSASLDGFEKTLVIKKMRPELSDDPEFFSLFIDEARITIGFQHPNVVQVFDFGNIDGSYYLAMEYVRGCDLGTLLLLDTVRGKGMDPGLALVVLSEILHGLDYAHRFKDESGTLLHVVHRDISPGNIMLSTQGAVKIGDFGIADSTDKTAQTQPGFVLGKVAYMAPEHARGERVDRRGDIFSAGILAWEMLVGAHPHNSQSESFLKNVVSATIPPPSSRRPELPKEVDDLVMTALAADPDDRYQSARQFGQIVHSVLVKHYPDASTFGLQGYLERHSEDIINLLRKSKGQPVSPGSGTQWEEETGRWDLSLADGSLHPGGDTVRTPMEIIVPPPKTQREQAKSSSVKAFSWPRQFVQQVEAFRDEPSLWTLVRMGDACLKRDEEKTAIMCWRAAAMKFSQAGLMAQAIFCFKRIIEKIGYEAVEDEVMSLALLPGKSNEEVEPYLRLGDSLVGKLLRELLGETLPVVRGTSTPLLRYLSATAIANFTRSAKLRQFPAGSCILKQGSLGRSMYLIAKGRVVVYATSPEGKRISLSSLMAGDFFGENGFFSGASRSAHVEAMNNVWAFEIDEALYHDVMENNPTANATLLQFYKERVVDTLLARSPTFGTLPQTARRQLSEAFMLREYPPGKLIIAEGDDSRDIYIIKSGEAEAYTCKGGPRTSLSKIEAGSVFGEIAALRGMRRTASIEATTALEALVLDGTTFLEILEEYPEVKSTLLEIIAVRARDNLSKLGLG